MFRCRISLVLVVGLAGVVGVAGCGEDPRQRIALLEQENQQLLDELSALHGEAGTAQRDRDLCDQELAGLRADNTALRGRIGDLEAAEPEVPEGWTAVPGGAMIAIPGEVLFKSGKADLRPEARQVLDQVVRVVNSEYPTQDVLIYGHTDNQPIKKSGWKDNYELSAQRALAVVRHLQSRGVSAARLVAAGCGEHRPAAPNTSQQSRAKNRRVEIYVLEAAMQTAGR
jgi:flagellar motor protein MotB